jgi:collagen type VII alpha
MRRLTHRGLAVASTVTATALMALTLPGGLAQAATSVGLATLKVSSQSAQATEVTYTIGFTATSGLAAGGKVTLTGPAGTAFPASGSNWTLADDTTGNDGGTLNFTSTGTTAIATLSGLSVNPGDRVTITALGIGNTSTAGSHNLAVSTSADTTPVNAPFTIKAKRAVGSVTAQLSSSAVSATGVTYTVGFTATDGLWKTGSTITLTAPSGTKFPAPGAADAAYFVNNDGGPADSCGPSTVSVTGSGDTVTLTCGGAGAQPIPSGNRVTVSITGVKNAGTVGTKTLSVTTTSDPKTASASYSLSSSAGLTSVAAPMLTRSSSAAGASATWTVGFTATQGWFESQVKLTAPAGTTFPANASEYSAYNDTSGNVYGVSLVGTPGRTVTLVADAAAGFGNDEFEATPVAAGDHITLTISGVTNPAGGGSLSLSTGADPVAVSIPLTGSASTPNLTLTSTSAGASAVEYVAGFTATVTKTVTTVTLTFPAGTTFFSTASCDLIRDDTTGDQGICLTPSVTGDTVTLTTSSTFGQFTVSAGDYVTVAVYGVTNTTSTGSQSVGLTTSDVSGTVTLPGFSVTAAAPVTSPGVLLDSYAAGATQASYTVSFIASEGLDTGGDFNVDPSSITITVPGATFTASNVCDLIFDGSNGQPSNCPNNPPVISGGGDTITINDLAARVAPGDQVTVFVFGGQNPPAAGSHQLTVSTSGSNGAASPPGISFTAATKVTDAALWLSSSLHGATNVTYTVGFTVANGLSGGNDAIGGSTVTITAPAGTVFPSNGCTGVTVRDDTYWTAGCAATTGGGTNVLTISGPQVQPKDHVTVTIEGVTNAAAGSKTLHVSTSSDATSVPVTYHLT